MNDASKLGITIAGVSIASAIASVLFYKLNPEPIKRSSYENTDYYEDVPPSRQRRSSYEKADDYEGVTPPRQLDWARKEAKLRPDEFEEPRNSFQNEYEELEPEKSSRQSDDFQSFDETESGDPVPVSAQGPVQGSTQGSTQGSLQGPVPVSAQGSLQGPVPVSAQGSTQGSAQGPGPSMIGGTRHTRCKHCHSRLKYTRRK